MANEKDYIPEGTGKDNSVQEGDDLKSSSKDTLGSYLSSLTKAADTANAFPIENTPRVETSLRGSSGLPSEFKTGGEDSESGFTNTFPTGGKSSESAVSNFKTLSNSGKIENLSDVLNKNSQKDGHNLLRDVVSNREPGEPGVGDYSGASAMQSPAGETPVQKKISSMLVNGNRFDPTPGSSPYIEDGQFTEPGIPITQAGFGVYDDEIVRTSLDDLHKVAHSIMVRSTGHRLSDSSDPDGGNELSTTDVQMGSKRVNSEKLRAGNAFAAPDKLELVDAELRFNDVDGSALEGQPSYGVLSSYREPFEGAVFANLNTAVQSLGEYLLGAAVFTALITLVELLEELEDPHTPESPIKLSKGSWHTEGTILRMFRQFGFPELKAPAWKCAIYGFAAWLKLPPSALPDAAESPPSIPSIPGFETPSGDWAKIVDWFSDVASESDDVLFNALYGSGYYATIMRVIRRDLEKMLGEVSFATSSETSGPDAARVIFELLMSLDRYPAWNFFVAILRMGDAWISSYNKYVKFGALHTSGQTRQMMSRQPGSNFQAWRHRSSPALVLLNEKYVNASVAFGYDNKFLRTLHTQIGDNASRSPGSVYWENLRVGANNRGMHDGAAWNIKRESKENVVLIENELDAEYCPFYFHDLRTNEVISFHAFLSDLKDSYAVSYAESGGYGRIDKVKIYQDTTRSINLTWTMVATSPADFDSMWWSVNKLVSMIYPQFSLGKSVKAGGKKFVMPFSQIPTASPVIRLRVGDVIRSNYSRFNLARIFGLSEIKLASPSGTPSKELAAAAFNVSSPTEAATAAAKEEAASSDKSAFDDYLAASSARFSQEPSSHSDEKHGFLPGDELWGEAYLKPGRYTTYDTKAGEVVKISTLKSPAKNTYSQNAPEEGAKKVSKKPFASNISTTEKVKILERVVRNIGEKESIDTGDEDAKEGTIAEYYVQFINRDSPADPYGPASSKGHFHTYVVTADSLTKDDSKAKKKTPVKDANIDLDQQIGDVYDFFDPENNPVVRSFESAGGRGLAGVITSLDLDWTEAQWDMSSIGRRAPTLIKISIGFSPIHDIVPGLDNNGMMRAMNYPVGSIAGALGTDYHDPGGIKHPSDTIVSDREDNYYGFAQSIDKDGEGGTD